MIWRTARILPPASKKRYSGQPTDVGVTGVVVIIGSGQIKQKRTTNRTKKVTRVSHGRVAQYSPTNLKQACCRLCWGFLRLLDCRLGGDLGAMVAMMTEEAAEDDEESAATTVRLVRRLTVFIRPGSSAK
jgi:hypothetical protein